METLIFKSVVVLVLLFILFSLGSGLFYLVRDRGQSTRTVRSLTIRVALSIGLFLLLLLGFATGIIRPHGANPAEPAPQTEKAP